MEDETYKALIRKIEAQGPHKIYQSWEKLGIDGQRPTEMRYFVYGLEQVITKSSTVLDLGSNVGFMSLAVAEYAREVHGIERRSDLVEIANLAKECIGIGNCFFHTMNALNFQAPYEFDLILSLSFHHWGPDIFARFVDEVFIGNLKAGGHLLFESHGLKSRKLFEEYSDYLRSVGFEEQWNGVCQCPTNYPCPNPHRKFYMFKLMQK